MGNNFPNITPEVIAASASEIAAPVKNTGEKKSTFDTKDYLDVKVGENEHSNTLNIRLLPMDDSGNPFLLVHVHHLSNLPKEVSLSGYKAFMCLSQNPDVIHEKYGKRCPFCELRSQFYKKSCEETDPIKKKELQKMSCSYIPGDAVIVRCIQRGKEEEGVKFWKFNLRTDATDPYHTILRLYKSRAEQGKELGLDVNILDLYKGRDLEVTFTKGNAAPTIIDGGIERPVTNDMEQLRRWLYEGKKWYEVFTPKPYDYLSLVAAGRVPWFDKRNNRWIDKEEYMTERQQQNPVNTGNPMSYPQDDYQAGYYGGYNQQPTYNMGNAMPSMDTMSSMMLDDDCNLINGQSGDMPF